MQRFDILTKQGSYTPKPIRPLPTQTLPYTLWSLSSTLPYTL